MGPPNTKKLFSIKDQGTAKKKKRKGKPALSKEEREREKLAKAAEEFQRDSQEYGLFLDRMDKWLKAHQEQAMQLFGKYDRIGNEILHYEEFKLGMRDLKIPCVEAQLHILARLLDPNNTGTIDYVELGAGLEKARYRQGSIEEEDEENEEEVKEVKEANDRIAVRGGKERHEISQEAGTTLVITKEKLNHCPGCHLGLQSPLQVSEARYISLDLRLISLSNSRSHPGHLQRTVRSHVKVYGLIGQIRAWTGIESTTLRIFKDQSCSQESCLPLELSLEQCGFPGGPFHSPTSALLFYDYWIEFSDCPILNCDHYINFRGRHTEEHLLL
ncbi:uncharacterized protein [Mobula birostris]|uniref:uncharacterized protein n=1 Tax=Mobula birostris TaxID=1983395 RepID=UPI003B2801FA